MPRAPWMFHVLDVLFKVQGKGGMRGVEETLKFKYCEKEISLLRTNKGKTIPIDMDTVDAADEYFERDHHVTHFRTCPEAGKFRKVKK
jgi:hypothetical protein